MGTPSPYSAPPVELNTTGAPWRRAASSTFSVPATFTAQSRCGSCTETVTLAWAARWKMTSGSARSATAAKADSSATSTVSSSAAGLTRSARPEERSSTTTTRVPSATSESTRWEPMKPAPPVTMAVAVTAGS